MLQYWRVWLLVIMVMGAIFSIGLKTFPYGREGVEIVYISQDSPAKEVLQEGMTITSINNEKVKTPEEWNAKTQDISGTVVITANGQEYKLNVSNNLGINVIGIERTNLDFGLDVKGGTRVILKPQANATEELVDQTVGVLETRANLFGLREIKFSKAKDISGQYLIQIEAAGVGNEIVDELLSKQGKFEAKIIKPAVVKNAAAELVLGSEKILITVENDTLRIDNSIIRVNETITVKGVGLEYVNRTGDNLIFLAKTFDGKDIELVYTDPQRSGIIPGNNVYEFFFSLLISTEGAQRFADITTGIPKVVDVNSGEEYLDSSLLLYLDGKLVSSLRIGASLAGQAIQSPQVTGSELTLEDAVKEKLRLQTILQSGASPLTLESVSVDVISPTLGVGFFDSIFKAIILATAVVFVIVFVRYRSFKIAVPMIITTVSEIVIILGIAAIKDQLLWGIVFALNIVLITAAWLKKQEIDISAIIGALIVPLIGLMSWTVDLPAIAGIISVIGTGINHQIIIADETLKGSKKVYGFREQLKTAFFIIFGAAATVIAAMIPLIFIGVGSVRGFAITTIVGVLVGVMVTRPAYGKIVEKLSEAKVKQQQV